jgi:hypothetical protein
VNDRVGGGLIGQRIEVGNVKDRAGRIDGLKNQSGKCEGPGEGDQRVKKSEWKM